MTLKWHWRGTGVALGAALGAAMAALEATKCDNKSSSYCYCPLLLICRLNLPHLILELCMQGKLNSPGNKFLGSTFGNIKTHTKAHATCA